MPGKASGNPEIHLECLELRAKYGWEYDKIAQHLHHKRGVSHPQDPTKPVHKGTIMKWIRRAATQKSLARMYTADVEQASAGLVLDLVKEMLGDLIESGRLETVDDTIKVVKALLAMQQERSSTFGVYAPKRKEVALTGGVGVKGISSETEAMLSALEMQVEANQTRRRGQRGWNDAS